MCARTACGGVRSSTRHSHTSQAADAANVFNVFVTAFVQDETRAGPRSDIIDTSPERLKEQVRQGFKRLPAARYPSLVALADELVDPDMDRQFSFGLNALLTGLETALAADHS